MSPAALDLKKRVQEKLREKAYVKPIAEKKRTFRNKKTGQMFNAEKDKDIELFSKNSDIEEVVGGKKRKRVTKKRKTVRKH
jgi:hypothetical protein